MSRLLVSQNTPDKDGRVVNITPESAGWRYVGFEVFHLKAGQTVSRDAGDREQCIVIVEGRGSFTAGDTEIGELGERLSVFDRTPPAALYVPNGKGWSVTATTDLVIGIGSAPATSGHDVRVIRPEDIVTVERGQGANKRLIHNIMMEDQDWADSLLLTEVYTPQGNWSSYPPHRHDESKGEESTYLEETYYHRLNPKQGFAIQRVYTDDRSLDETISFRDGEVVLVPKGYHPVGAPYGYDLYYLNVMAGPERKWRFKNDPDHDWIYQRDSKPA
jgi:5-deoxy-glucuronate isomerase